MKYSKLSTLAISIVLFSCTENKKEISLTKADDTVAVKTEKTAEEKTPDKNNDLKDSDIIAIKKVIAHFQENDPKKIAVIIQFPLKRQYPIPSIKNKAEFIQRYREVFDATLIDKIASSKLDQWSEVGWRGLMLDNGVIWMANYDVVITTVNYESDFEKNLREKLISKEKGDLHPSLQTFKAPVYSFKTKNYLIRIDELENGNYRYASWKIGAKGSSKPDVIIDNGQFEFHGSGGNHNIIFTKGNFTYDIYRGIIGEKDAPEITLEVKENNKTILQEAGILLKK